MEIFSNNILFLTPKLIFFISIEMLLLISSFNILLILFLCSELKRKD